MLWYTVTKKHISIWRSILKFQFGLARIQYPQQQLELGFLLLGVGLLWLDGVWAVQKLLWDLNWENERPMVSNLVYRSLEATETRFPFHVRITGPFSASSSISLSHCYCLFLLTEREHSFIISPILKQAANPETSGHLSFLFLFHLHPHA